MSFPTAEFASKHTTCVAIIIIKQLVVDTGSAPCQTMREFHSGILLTVVGFTQYAKPAIVVIVAFFVLDFFVVDRHGERRMNLPCFSMHDLSNRFL